MTTQIIKQFESFSQNELESLQFQPEELADFEQELYPDLQSISFKDVAEELVTNFENSIQAEGLEDKKGKGKHTSSSGGKNKNKGKHTGSSGSKNKDTGNGSSPGTNGQSSSSAKGKVLWSNGFATDDWKKHWTFKNKGWLQNIKVIDDPSGKFKRVLRVRYPKGSATHGLATQRKAPFGGTGFYASLGIPPQDALRLSYYLRFSENFDFVKGGKLPGIFGGKGGSGGKVPNGTDGFTTRFMWRRKGDGEVYAYLANSPHNSFGRGNWRFQPGVWCHLEQEVVLNQPGEANGRIRVWADGKQVLDQQKLTFRTVDTLKIDGIYFSTFFGGSDLTWATPKDVHVDFAEFSVLDVN